MKKLLLILLFAGFAATASAQVKFVTRPTDTVYDMAKQEKKLVFIDLYATWCPPCQVMDKQVFSRKDVGEFMNKHFVNVKYDTDKSTGKEFVEKYKIEGIPTFLMFNIKGELIGRISGASTPEKFLEDVRKVLQKNGSGK